ncbi:MAG TPA: bacteriohemerythrin [Desulfobacterales bacterium]|nr:bacteriohemerythrin [Desulfobacterales bacterium]
MSKIEWQDEFSVHNEDIDRQHQKWLAIYNKMHVTMMEGDNDALDSLGQKALDEMEDYAQKHFAFEEDYMQQLGYTELSAHQLLHKNFYTMLNKFRQDMTDGEIVLNSHIIKTVKNWLLSHILVEDQKYALFADRKK